MNVTEGKFDYAKPIFAFYLSVAGFSRQRAQEEIAHCYESINSTGLQHIIIPVGESSYQSSTRIECIWGGNKLPYNQNMIKVVKEIGELLNQIADPNLKDNLNRLIIDKLISEIMEFSEQPI